jgi:polyisoprenoid-binding protein YceI
MKRMLKLLLLLVISLTSAQTQSKLNLVPSESKLSWKGFVTLNFGDGHHGIIQGIAGTVVTAADGKIQNGNFTLDMNTIKVLDMETDKGREDLAQHLKSDDFFAVGTYPQGFFSIIAVTYSESNTSATIDGFLGLKGVTNRISFPVTIESDGKSIRTRGSVTIDRTKWNVNHQSPSIFSSLKDGAISDQVIIELDLRFRKSD